MRHEIMAVARMRLEIALSHSLELQQGPDIPVRVALAYIARGVLDPAVAKVLFHVVGHIYGANPAL